MKVLDLFVSYNFREEIVFKFILDFKLWIFKQKSCSEQNLILQDFQNQVKEKNVF